MRGALLALLIAAPLSAQSLELAPVQARGNVGDILTVKITAHMRPGQELLEFVPKPLLPPPEGMRIVSTDTLRQVDEDTWTGNIRLAFYRIGKQPVPTLGLLYRVETGALPDTLVQAPLSIEIVPILAAGNPQLRDIKPLQRIGGPPWVPLIALLLAVGAAIYWLFRRRKGVTPLWSRRAPAGPVRTAFGEGIRQLDALEGEVIAGAQEIPSAYAQVAEVIRGTLLNAGLLPHPGLTTGELRSRLPIELADGGQGDTCAALLADADLVKFAKLRPDLAAIQGQIARARALLAGWEAGSVPIAKAA